MPAAPASPSCFMAQLNVHVQGMLSLGAAELGATHVLAIDVDDHALGLCHQNCRALESTAVRHVSAAGGLPPCAVATPQLTSRALQVDMMQVSVQSLAAMQRLRVDTVVMNPPFGTRTKGADLDFLHAALQVRGGPSQLKLLCALSAHALQCCASWVSPEAGGAVLGRWLSGRCIRCTRPAHAAICRRWRPSTCAVQTKPC